MPELGNIGVEGSVALEVRVCPSLCWSYLCLAHRRFVALGHDYWREWRARIRGGGGEGVLSLGPTALGDRDRVEARSDPDEGPRKTGGDGNFAFSARRSANGFPSDWLRCSLSSSQVWGPLRRPGSKRMASSQIGSVARVALHARS